MQCNIVLAGKHVDQIEFAFVVFKMDVFIIHNIEGVWNYYQDSVFRQKMFSLVAS